MTSPSAVAVSTSAWTESREETSTVAVLTSKPASRSTSAAASAFVLLQVGQHDVLAGADPSSDRLADRPGSDDDDDFAHRRSSSVPSLDDSRVIWNLMDFALVHRAVAVRHILESSRCGRRHGRARSDPRAHRAAALRCTRAPARGRRAIVRSSRSNVRSASSSCCGTPTRPIAPPGRAIASAVSIACSMTDALEHRVCAEPSVSSRTRSIASSPRSRDDVSGAELAARARSRSGLRPSRMICSAPSRFAAITPQSPTAPSPTTATILPGPTSARPRRGGRCP